MLVYYQKEDLSVSKEIERKNLQQIQRDQPSVRMTGRNETVDYSKLNLLFFEPDHVLRAEDVSVNESDTFPPF